MQGIRGARRGLGLCVDSGEAHQAHEALDVLAADADLVGVLKRPTNLPRTVERTLCEDRIDRMHDPDGFGIGGGCVVDAGAGNIQERGLPHEAQCFVIRISQGYPLGVVQVAIFFSARRLLLRAGRVTCRVRQSTVPAFYLLWCAYR